MLKASSLSNAIFVCLMISIFSGCLVLISHYQNLLNYKLSFRETLIDTNDAAFNFYLLNPDKLNFDKGDEIDVFENDIITFSTKKKWGFYTVLSSQTIFKNDTINRIGLVGNRRSAKDMTTLFVTDYDESLQLSGTSKLIGNAEVPNGDIDEAYINNQEGNTIETRGRVSASKKRLPQLKTNIDFNINAFKNVNLSYFKSKVITNSFSNETIVINISNIKRLNTITLKGNIILYTSGDITLENTAQLNDVVLIADRVFINSGFSGNLQIVAKQEVIVESHSQLKYPSSIYLKNDNDSIKVHFKPNSKLAGGIILTGNTYKGALKRNLIIDADSELYGSIYCYGNTQLQGTINGQIYTDRFYLKTQSSEYENVILNGTINSESLPDNFVLLPLFDSEYNSTRYEIIKEL